MFPGKIFNSAPNKNPINGHFLRLTGYYYFFCDSIFYVQKEHRSEDVTCGCLAGLHTGKLGSYSQGQLRSICIKTKHSKLQLILCLHLQSITSSQIRGLTLNFKPNIREGLEKEGSCGNTSAGGTLTSRNDPNQQNNQKQRHKNKPMF